MSSPPPVSADMAAVMGFSTFGDAAAANRPAKRARRDFTVVDCSPDQPAQSTQSKKARLGAEDGERPAGLPAKPPPPQDFGGSAAWRGGQRGGHRGRGRGQPGFGARGGRQQGQHQNQHHHQSQHQNQQGQRHNHSQQNQHRQHGQKGKGAPRNELWYVEYYDPMCNENPWEALEQRAGIPARGTWLARGHGYADKGHKADAATEAMDLETQDPEDAETNDLEDVEAKGPEAAQDKREEETEETEVDVASI